jgi:hypothetical protein
VTHSGPYTTTIDVGDTKRLCALTFVVINKRTAISQSGWNKARQKANTTAVQDKFHVSNL